MRRLLTKLIPHSTRGRWTAGLGAGAGLALLIYLVFFVFGFHLIFVDEVVDEEAPEFAAVDVDVDELISEALAGGGSQDRAALAEQRSALEVEADRMREEAMADGSDEAMGEMYGHLDPMLEAIVALSDAEEQMMTDEDVAQAESERREERDESVAAAGEMADEEAGAVRVSAVGRFISRSHPSSGTAAVLTDGTQTFLRFDDDFETDNGPDLNVYLSAAGPEDSVSDLGADFIDLGDMKGNIGAQNYEVPAGTDLARYRTVVVWCVRFSVAFGAAELEQLG